jgi:hypothetical protein
MVSWTCTGLPPPVDQQHDGGQARTANATRTESAFLRGWKRSPHVNQVSAKSALGSSALWNASRSQ